MIRVWKSQVEVISGKGWKCKGFIIELGKTALFFFFFFPIRDISGYFGGNDRIQSGKVALKLIIICD